MMIYLKFCSESRSFRVLYGCAQCEKWYPTLRMYRYVQNVQVKILTLFRIYEVVQLVLLTSSTSLWRQDQIELAHKK